MNEMELHCCRVCGLHFDDFCPWGESGKEPSYDICPCCGIEFGYGDETRRTVLSYRKFWFENNGAQWFHPEDKPKNWSLVEQFKNIPKEFQDDTIDDRITVTVH